MSNDTELNEASVTTHNEPVAEGLTDTVSLDDVQVEEIDHRHKDEHVEYVHNTKNGSTKYDVDVKVGTTPFTNIETVDHDISIHGYETRHNGMAKSYRDETLDKTVSLNNTALRSNEKHNINTSRHDAKGNIRSIETIKHEHTVMSPSAMSVAQGHTEALDMTRVEEKIMKFDRNGNIKEEDHHVSYSSNTGNEYHKDLNVKGNPSNPNRVNEVTLQDDGQEKELRVININKNSRLDATVKEGEETYRFSKNNKTYNVNVGVEGDINATKRVEKKDGTIAEKEMGDLSSKIMLGSMHRKTDRSVNKVTEHNGAQDYLDSVNAEKGNISMLGDPFESMPENYAEIEAQVAEDVKNKFDEQAQIIADELLREQLKKDKVWADKLEEDMLNQVSQVQEASTGKENVSADKPKTNTAVNVAMMQRAGQSR